MTSLFYTHKSSLGHETPDGHPEQVARISAIKGALDQPWFEGVTQKQAPKAKREHVLLGHPKSYLAKVEAAVPATGMVRLDEDTTMTPGSYDAAMHSLGGTIDAIDQVVSGHAKNAFIACRPPGHHAEKTTAMGFCIFSTVALAALYALQHHGLKRVAVFDFDVHHGNGTQDVLWDEPNIRFISSHQMPLYPGTGSKEEIGAHGQITNIPLESGSDGDRMKQVWGDVLDQEIKEFAPELILVSAGFDAHIDDPLANLCWNTEDYAWLAHKICDVADLCCAGRVVSSLEGGYDLAALGDSVNAYLKVMMERSR